MIVMIGSFAAVGNGTQVGKILKDYMFYQYSFTQFQFHQFLSLTCRFRRKSASASGECIANVYGKVGMGMTI